MKTTLKDKRPISSLKKLRLALLAGTCLTSAQTVQATTLNESTDFSNTFAGRTALPFGTDVVNGTVTSIDTADFVDFSGLLPNGSFTLAFAGVTAFGAFNFSSLDSSAAPLGSPGFSQLGNTATFTGTVPLDGHIVAAVGYNSEGSPYSINLTAATVPEPSIPALVGLGLLTAALRRKRGNPTLD